MVNTERYIKTYLASMPRRLEEYAVLLEEKRKLSEGNIDEKRRLRLLEIIGKDTLFHDGSARERTLRHLQRKIERSSRFFERMGRELLAKDLPANIRNVIIPLVEATKEYARDGWHLNLIYEHEVEMLVRKDIEGYQRFVKEEFGFREPRTVKRYVTIQENFQRSFRSLATTIGDHDELYAAMLFFLTGAALSIAVIVAFCSGTIAPAIFSGQLSAIPAVVGINLVKTSDVSFRQAFREWQEHTI